MTSLTWACFPVTTRTRAPMALRFDFVPIHFTFSQLFFAEQSFRNSDGGSFILMMTMSTSPSLSKSPKAAPRLGRGSLRTAPLSGVTSAKCPFPRLRYMIFRCLKVRWSFLVSTSGKTWPFDINMSGHPSLSKSKRPTPHPRYRVLPPRPPCSTAS